MMRFLTTSLFLTFFALPSILLGQSKVVSGTITDAETNTTLPGVNVIEKNTSNGTVTDADGKYNIQVGSEATLIYSFVGYEAQEIAVGGQSTINVNLLGSASELEEVVVVAYGTQKREAITSSVAKVDAKELTDITVPDVSTMLQGKAAGVQVASSSGAPGSVPQILIRGASSLNGSVVPLWVVDGVIQHGVPIINPADVENISILKDASATSLYGSRGANGVVIVTTKRGEIGKGQVTFSAKLGMNEFNDGRFEVMNSQQLYDYHTQFGNSQPWYTSDLLNRDYDWLEGGTQTGIVNDYNVSFTAGTEKLNTYINAGYYSEKGTIRGDELDRYTFRMNFDYQLNDRLKIMPKLAYSFDVRDRVAEAPRYELYLNLPWDNPFDADGIPINAQESSEWIGRDQRNYFYDQQWNYSSSEIINLSSNFDFEYTIFDNLTYVSTNNFTLYDSQSKSYTDPQSNAGLATNGRINDFAARRLTRLSTQMLRFEQDFGQYELTVLGGYEFNDYRYQDFNATGEGIIAGTEILNVATEPGSIGGFKNDYALQSFFLATDHSFEDRYFAKASIRRDGASNFGLENQYGTFFALGAGWNIHNEDFFSSRVFDELKIRVSYGSVGNRPSSLYPYQGTYRADTQYDALPAVVLDQFGNPDLKWEKSYETNLAVDALLFGRINTTVEYYNKNTSDLLYFVNLPDLTGFSGFWENVGGVTNRGIEAAVSADIIQRENFNWNLGFNIGINRNEITELFDGQTEIPRGNKIFTVGEDYNSWYTRKWIGVDTETGDPLWEVYNRETGERTETTDYNQATLQRIGTSTPDFIGGFNTGLSYKNVSLTANFAFSRGGTIYNASRELFDSDGFYPTFNQQILIDDWSRWQQAGDVATHPRAVEGGNNNSNKPSSRYLEDGSYLRMTNVTLSYTVPAGILEGAGIGAANFYVAADNLLTITNFSGVDPAVGGINGSASLSYPIPQRVVLGLNVTF